VFVTIVASAGVGLEGGATARAAETPFEQRERSAAVELFAAEAALARARDDAARAAQELSAAVFRVERTERHARLLRRSVEATQARATETLRRLYIEGDRLDPIAIILGADSLDAALDGLDGLAHITSGQRRLVAELEASSARLERTLAIERERRARAAEAARVAAAAVHRQAAAVGNRAATLDRIRAARRASAARIAALAAEAERSQVRATEIQREAEETTPAAAASAETETEPVSALPPPGESRTLVVDAVAYHLPGRTASGLPVGIGVVAVDPRVIPLGTRLFIPGYGPGVAADTGSAIKGNIIDLWMPTTAQARAWGRRTVTITIYG
jgi:3D (Asp-Asp-Asp) domain-containing protein